METTIQKTDLATLYTPGQLDVLNQLNELKTKLGLSDGQFVQKHLTLSGTTWSRLNSGTYQADGTSAFIKLESNLRQLRVELSAVSKFKGNQKFHVFLKQRAAMAAITTCKLKPEHDANRFVAYLAPTGGGKTSLGRHVQAENDAIYIEAKESWRTKYLSAMIDISRAAGVNEADLTRGENVAETALIKRLRANRRVLIIDEGEYFGPKTINLIKLILNQTPTVVLLLSIPELFERWQKAAWEEARQINRRAEAIIRFEGVTIDEVQDMLPGADKKAAAAIAAAANAFGAYDLVNRVVTDLAGETAINEAQAHHALRCVKALFTGKSAA
jgi:DNA transposition AAA+ family ATPase